MTIWKFPLRWGQVSVSIPAHGQIVHVGRDPASEYPAVWAVVDPDAELEQRSFAVVGTGWWPLPVSYHVGTFVDGEFVWHVFETTPSKVNAYHMAELL